jgi:hypothetical protein
MLSLMFERKKRAESIADVNIVSAPTLVSASASASKEFVNSYKTYMAGLNELKSHYLMLRGLFDFFTFDELDSALEKLSSDSPVWPDQLFG